MAEIKRPEYLAFETNELTDSDFLFKIPQTYTDVGAAPAGYGYGEYLYIGAETGENLTDKIDALTASWENNTTKQYTISDHTFYGYTIVATISKFNNDYILITGTTYNGCQVIRRKNVEVTGGTGVWQEWEWVNPPMAQTNQVYRTTERYFAQPVYTALIQLGTPTASPHEHLLPEDWNVGKVIRFSGHISTGEALPYISGSLTDNYTAYLKANSAKIFLYTGQYMRNRQYYCQIWFTKKTS